MTDARPPHDPRLGRQRAMATYLRVCMGLVLLLALAGAVVPETGVDEFGVAMVLVLILAPIGRVLWLIVRWLRRGDRRYALAAVALLGVMGLALVLA